VNTEASEDRPILKEFGRKPGLSYDGRGLLFPSIHPILLPNVATRTRREYEADAIEYLADTQEESKPVSLRDRPLLFLLRI